MSGGHDPLEEPEAHENHERYLITYADMITLLMALFIILFAIGQTDLEKYAKFAEGAHQAVGGSSSLLTGGGAVVDSAVGAAAGGGSAATASSAHATVVEDTDESVHTGEVTDPAEALATRLADLLRDGGHDAASVAADDRGVVVTLPGDDITFEPGSWSLLPEGLAAVHAVADALRTVDHAIVVNGHTDDRPMAAPLTNWELSTNRASAVVRELAASGLPNGRLAAAGYADTKPIGDNATAAGRAANRRVEIVVLVRGAAGASGAHSGQHIGPPAVDVLAPTVTAPKASPSGGGH